MLDLKAKLASAGLVTQDEIARVDAEKAKAKAQRKNRGKGKGKSKGKGRGRGAPGLDVKALSAEGVSKGEMYAAVRRWVDKVRLDARGVPTESAKAFHFPQLTGRIGRLTMEPGVAKQVERGEAGLIAYMSNSGLAHAVVPAAGARDIASLKEEWLRVLAGDERAGRIERETDKEAP